MDIKPQAMALPSDTSKLPQGKYGYKVNALGVGSNITLTKLRLSAGFKYFKEFSNRSTFQGYSVQFSGSFHF